MMQMQYASCFSSCVKRRMPSLTPPSPQLLQNTFTSLLKKTKNTQKSWLWHVWNSITDLLRMHSALPREIGGESAARWRPCRLRQTKITMAWAAAKSWAAAHRHSKSNSWSLIADTLQLSPSRSAQSGQWKSEGNTHCWPLLSIIHVLLRK